MRALLAIRARAVGGTWTTTLLAFASVAMSVTVTVGALTLQHSFATSVHRATGALSSLGDAEVRGSTFTGVSDEVVAAVGLAVPESSVVPIVRSRGTFHGTNCLLLGVDDNLGGERSDVDLKLDLDLSAAASSTDLLVVLGPAFKEASPGALVINGEKTKVVVAGTIDGDVARKVNEGRFIATSVRSARKLTGRTAGYDSVIVVAPDDAARATLQSRLRAAVGGSALVNSPADVASEAEAAARPVVGGATLLAAVVSAVAALVLYNTLELIVLQRRRDTAILRLLGASPRAVSVALVAEFVAIGVAGAGLGVFAGRQMATVLIGRFPAYLLEAFDVSIQRSTSPAAIALGMLVGIGCAVAGTYIPARRAGRGEPLATLHAPPSDVSSRRGPRRGRLSASLCLGAAAVWAGVARPAGAAPALVVAAAATGFLLVELSSPIVAATSKLAEVFGSAGSIPSRWLRAAGRRTWIATISVAIAIAAVVAQQQVRADFVHSITEALAPLAGADVYVSTIPPGGIGASASLLPEVILELEHLPHVSAVAPHLTAFATIQGQRVLLEGFSEASALPALKGVEGSTRARVLRGEAVLVSRQVPDAVAAGNNVRIPTPQGLKTLPIAGRVDSYLWDGGVIMVGQPTLSGWFAAGPSDVQLFGDGTVTGSALAAAVRNALHDERTFVSTGTEVVERARSTLEDSTSLFGAIEVLTAVAAWFAVVDAMLIGVLNRRRDIGLLRSLNARKGLVVQIVVVEAVVISAIGAMLGVVLSMPLHALELNALENLTRLPLAWSPPVRPMLLALVLTPPVALFASAAAAWRATTVAPLELVKNS